MHNVKTVRATVLGGLWALEWACHSAETNLRCAGISGICTPSPRIVACIVSEILAFMRTDGQTDGRTDGQTDMVLILILIKNIYTLWGRKRFLLPVTYFSYPDQEYIYFMGSETLPSACYILSEESSIPFYSTSNRYKKINKDTQINIDPLLNDIHSWCEYSSAIKPILLSHNSLLKSIVTKLLKTEANPKGSICRPQSLEFRRRTWFTNQSTHFKKNPLTHLGRMYPI